MKRYVETDRWDTEPLYRALPAQVKQVFDYIRDKCNKAGFWQPSFDALCADFGKNLDGTPVSITKDQVLPFLNGLVYVHASGVWQVIGWFRAQYPKATPSKCNGVAESAFDLLKAFSFALGPQVDLFAGVPLSSEADRSHSTQKLGGGTPRVPQGDGDVGVDVGGGGGDSAPSNSIEYDLALAGIRLDFQPKNIPCEKVDEETEKRLRQAVDLHGGARVIRAAGLYAKTDRINKKSLRNFIEYRDTWLAQAKPEPKDCPHKDTETRRVPLDEFKLGKAETVTLCRDCGKKTSETKRGPCAHAKGFTLTDPNAGITVEALKLSSPPYLLCQICGEERPTEEANGTEG